MDASAFLAESFCGAESIFQRQSPRRRKFFHTNYTLPPRHLIRRLTLGNAAGIFKDNLVPFGANAEGICPKRPSAPRPPSPQGEGILAGTLHQEYTNLRHKHSVT